MNARFLQSTRSKGPSGAPLAYVVSHERHASPELGTNVEQPVLDVEAAEPPVFGHVAQASRLVAAPLRALEHHRVDVRRQDLDLETRVGRSDPEPPDQGQRVGLLARGAARAPGREATALVGSSARERRQDVALETREHGRVALEAGDRDVAELVQQPPLTRVRREVGAVGGEVGEVELPQSPRDASADLAADSAEARPAQMHPRERPLEERDAVDVAYRAHLTAV